MSSSRALVFLLLFGCGDDPTPVKTPLPLDVAMKAAETRAGRVTQETELLTGPTAKGRIGDYKIYNSRIAVIIAQENTSRGFHPYGGTILDADRIRVDGAGVSTFGEVIAALDLAVLRADRIEVVGDGSDGEAARIRVTGEEDVMPLFDSLFSEIFPPAKHDMEWSVDYILEPDADWLRIELTTFNRGRETIEYGLPAVGLIFGDGADPFVEGYGFDPPSSGGTTDYYGAVAKEVSYLYGRPDARANIVITQSGIVFAGLGEGFKIRGRERKTVTHYLVVGDGDLSRMQALWRSAVGQESGTDITGRVTDESGTPVADARVHVVFADVATADRDYVTQTRTDPDGQYRLRLLPGEYKVVVATDAHLVSDEQDLTVGASPVSLDLSLPLSARINYQVRDDKGTELPVKLSVKLLGATVRTLAKRYGEAPRSYGLIRTEFAHTGRGTLDLPAGDYEVFVSRGGEYEIARETFTISATQAGTLDATLARSVDSTGWMITDTHVHAELSPDSPDLFPFKVRAMAAENLEIPVSTDHEAIGSFNPAIEALGLGRWMKGINGSEVTTYIYGHFNAFPLEQDFSQPGNGRISWYYKTPAETFAEIRKNPGRPFIQVNHPRSPSIGGYFSAMGYDRSTHAARRADEFSTDFDGIETTNGCGDGSMSREEVQDWFTFLNHGSKKVATGSTDNHRAASGNMGFPLTYVRMPTDEPAQASIDDVRSAFMEGRLVVSCGPFVEMKIEEAEIGDTVQTTSDLVTIQARVSAATWMDVDQIRVVVNGEVTKSVAIDPATDAERFNGTVTASVPPGRDSWIILWVNGDSPHGIWSRGRPSYAFTNPIYIDGDGDSVWQP